VEEGRDDRPQSEASPDDLVIARIGGETFVFQRLSVPDAAVVERYINRKEIAERPNDPAALERLRTRTAMAALTAAVQRADRERFRAALRRDRDRGGRESIAAVRKLLEQTEEAS
jgi:hypothetical protein